MPAKKPGLLVLSFDYPPVLNPVGIQISRLAEHAGFPLTVLCSQAHGPNQDAALEPNMNKLRADFFLARLQWVPPRIPWSFKLFRLDYLVTQMPDPQRAWSRRASAASLKLIRENPGTFAGLMTVGPPLSDHLSGLTIARMARLPWLVYWGEDPLDTQTTRINRHVLKFRRRSESLVFANASALVFPSQFLLDETLKNHPSALRDKAFVLPPSWSRTMYKAVNPWPKPTVLIRTQCQDVSLWKTFLIAMNRLKQANPELFQKLHFVCPNLHETQENILREFPDLAVVFQTKPASVTEEWTQVKAASTVIHLEDQPYKVNTHACLVESMGGGKHLIRIGPPGPLADLTQTVGGLALGELTEDALMVGLARAFTDPPQTLNDLAQNFEIGAVTSHFKKILSVSSVLRT